MITKTFSSESERISENKFLEHIKFHAELKI